MQGDVTKIIDGSGNVVVQYAYDSWGKVLSVTGSLASTVGAKNPIRYRGYYYDTESELYYLNSRYYDPEVGRFISPDVVAEDGNLYNYCQNDPVNRSDDSGYLSAKWRKILKWAAIATVAVATVAICAVTAGAAAAAIPVAAAFIGGGVGMGVSATTQYIATGTVNLEQMFFDGLVGAVNGAIATTGIGLIGSVALGGVVGGAASVGEDWLNDKTIDPLKMLSGVGLGMVGGLIAGSGANVKAGVSKVQYANYKLKTAVSAKKIAQYAASKNKVLESGIKAAARAAASIGFGTSVNRYVGGLPIWLG